MKNMQYKICIDIDISVCRRGLMASGRVWDAPLRLSGQVATSQVSRLCV